MLREPCLACRVSKVLEQCIAELFGDIVLVEPGGNRLVDLRALDSLSRIELSVLIEDELGLFIHHDDLVDMGDVGPLAELIAARANPCALDRFCTSLPHHVGLGLRPHGTTPQQEPRRQSEH